ncbi:MAG: DotU family type IV/VI secretion system protein [Planctomycetales bacterium]|nr:DotU family type IV/VI secretion system protein [Planctomycetales bacterium]
MAYHWADVPPIEARRHRPSRRRYPYDPRNPAMTRAASAGLYRVVSYGLDLLDALHQGEPRDMDREQAILSNLLMEIDDSAYSGTDQRGARYAASCWLDERFTDGTPWADAWNEQKLETALFGGNDRAWEFWRQAKLAETLRENDALEAYYLCAALGFRGELRNDPDTLNRWMNKTRLRVTQLTESDAEPDAETAQVPIQTFDARPLHGERQFGRAATAATLAALVALPIASYFVVTTFCR